MPVTSISFFPLLISNDNISDWPKLKAFEDNKGDVTEKLKFIEGSVENIMGKGENASYQHFLLLPQCLQKASFSGLSL